MKRLRSSLGIGLLLIIMVTTTAHVRVEADGLTNNRDAKATLLKQDHKVSDLNITNLVPPAAPAPVAPTAPNAPTAPTVLSPKVEVTVQINGKQAAVDPKPVIMDRSTFIPLRGVFEAMNAKVSWNSKLKSIAIKRGTTRVSITIGKKAAYVNGKAITIEQAPFVSTGGSVYVPLRFVSETIGAKVSWDPINLIASIDISS